LYVNSPKYLKPIQSSVTNTEEVCGLNAASVLKIDVLLEKESIVKIYITAVTIVRETSGKLLTKAYGIVHNVGLLRVS